VEDILPPRTRTHLSADSHGRREDGEHQPNRDRVDKKRGYPIYDRNPSVPSPNAIASKRNPLGAQSAGQTRREFLAPASHRLVGHDDTAFRQELCVISIVLAQAALLDGLANRS
jgi:hypothetical protein